MSQKEYTSTKDMLKGARKLFDQEKYTEAFPLYSQLLSIDRADPDLNYRFGVCLLFSDRSDTYAPISYLKKAIGTVSDPDLYYYLGYAFHINYYFPSAISYYQTYKKKVGKDINESFEVDRKIEMCQNGMEMMRSVQDLFVLKKTEVSHNEFFRSYNLHNYGVRVIKKPENFLNKEDKKKKAKDFIVFNRKSKVIYYSAYSSSNKNHRDIFKRERLSTGAWSKPEKLPTVINTKYDEDYPVMMPDGETFYFCSKGHNTIGGYDVFKSKFDLVDSTWSTPVNINFPFNTPTDDILFIPDSTISTAWFASDRNSVENKIMVYKVDIIKRPEGSTDLAAIFDGAKELTEDDMRQIKERASLDVNIQEDEYEQMPVIVEDPVAAAQLLHQQNLDKIQADIESKKQDQQIIDSAKMVIFEVERSIDIFDSIRREAINLAKSKRQEASRIRKGVKTKLESIKTDTNSNNVFDIVKELNYELGHAEQISFQAAEIDNFANSIKESIYSQKETFTDLNNQYGQAENRIVNGDKSAARTILQQMNEDLSQLPELSLLYQDYNNGELKNIQYPENIENPNEYVVFAVNDSDAANPQIESYSNEYAQYIPETKEAIQTDSEKEEKETYTKNVDSSSETTVNFVVLPSTELAFGASTKDQINKQYAYLLEQANTENKGIDSLYAEMEKKYLSLVGESQSAFNEAETIIAQAEKSPNEQKAALVEDANIKMQLASTKAQQASVSLQLLEEMQSAQGESDQLIAQITEKLTKLNTAQDEENWEAVRELYEAAEKDAQTNSAIVDFSDRMEVEVLNLQSDEGYAEDFTAYQLSSSGAILKTIGSASGHWNSYDDFTQDLASSEAPRNFMIPNTIDLSAKQENIVSIITPTNALNGDSIKMLRMNWPVVPEDTLLSNLYGYFKKLEGETQTMLDKRNAINTYYRNSIKQAAILEWQSISLMKGEYVTSKDIDRANAISADSKELLWKATIAASMLKEYDQAIFNRTSILAEAQKEYFIMDSDVQKNSQDYKSRYAQLQKDLKLADNQTVDDSNFDYNISQVVTETPEIFRSDDYQEFYVENGQLKRRDQKEIYQLLELNTADVNVDISKSPMIVSVQDTREQMSESEPAGQQQLVDAGEEKSQEINQIKEEVIAINDTLDAYVESIRAYLNPILILAEQKLQLSNEKNREAATASNPKQKQDLSKASNEYLLQASALKSLAENFQVFINEEEVKQKAVSVRSSQLNDLLNEGNLQESNRVFNELQYQSQSVHQSGADAIDSIQTLMIAMLPSYTSSIDSAYLLSQNLANESVKLLSEASEEKKKAAKKRRAFKRREMMKSAEKKEIRAAQLQNESDQALAYGNKLYQKSIEINALANLSNDLNETLLMGVDDSQVSVNMDMLFQSIDNRRQELLSGHTEIVSDSAYMEESIGSLMANNTLQAYEGQSYKTKMMKEELGLIREEISLLEGMDKSNLSSDEFDEYENQLLVLNRQADSVENDANKASVLTEEYLQSLSSKEQMDLDDSRNLDDYLADLRSRISKLLSEASALKQKAQRSNNLDKRKELFNQAQENEGIAMYYVLEEFELIGQKNKTHYRRNKLALQQMLMESINKDERNMMQNIFAQIDSYMFLADQKRDKAKSELVSSSMRKILLQDAYSLEMKALDLQQQASTMLKKHDVVAMQYHQSAVKNSTKEQQIATSQLEDSQISFDTPQGEFIYKVQFSAITELKTKEFFNPIVEITAEEVPNSSFIRYFSGSFNSLNDAIVRRNYIRSLGYSDAFIRKWKDGQAVSLLSPVSADSDKKNEINVATPSDINSNEIDYSVTNISHLSGTYYSVQVGVYSRPKTSAMINGIKPLYHKRLKDTYWVYYTGIYKSIGDATVRKDEVVKMGVSDAFIVAFSDGESISLSDARQRISKGGDIPSDEDIIILEDASLAVDNQWDVTQNNSNKTSITNDTPKAFVIQIGVYSKPISLNQISSQLDGNIKINMHQSISGKYIYTIGSYSSKEEARKYLSQIRKVVPDAFIASY